MTTVIYPTTNLTATEQLKFERGEGIYVYDQNGKQYLEGLAGLWCTGLGYGNQELIDTITPIITGIQERRKLVTDAEVEEFMRPRPLKSGRFTSPGFDNKN